MLSEPRTRPLVLLVEDSPGDVYLMRESFADLQVGADLHPVSTGQQCLDFLRRAGEFEDVARPDIILLDLNLPEIDGWTVLRSIIRDRNVRGIPVIVFSGSITDEDVAQAYDLRCSSVVRKPGDYVEFLRFVRLLRDYWLTAVALPRAKARPAAGARRTVRRQSSIKSPTAAI